MFLNLTSCSPFVYFGTVLVSKNENKANKHTPALCHIQVLMQEHNIAMFRSQPAESSICSENLPLWKLWKRSDIPVLWGVHPTPAVLLVLPSSQLKERGPFCKTERALRIEWRWKCLYLTGIVHFECSSWQVPSHWPPRLHSHAVLHYHLATQPSYVLDLVTLDNTTGRWYMQLPFRSTSLSRSVLLGMVLVLFYIGHSESKTTYLFPQKLQQLRRA